MRTVRFVYAGAGCLVLISYLLLPDLAQSVIYIVVGIAAVVAIIVGVVHYRPSVLSPWVLLAAAVAIYTLGDGVYAVDAQLRGTEPPFPSIADIPFMLFYVLLFLALLRFLGQTDDHDRAAWIDASFWAVGATVVAWEPLIEPSLFDTEATPLAWAVATAYPLLDILVLLVAVRLLVGRTGRNLAGGLVAAALVVQAITDIVYGAQVLDGTYYDGSVLDLGWMFTYLCLGFAGLQPSMRALTERNTAPVALTSRSRLLGLIAPALIVPAVLAAQLLSGDITGEVWDVAIVVFGVVVLVFLAGARGVGLIGVARRHADMLGARQRELEDALRDREHVAEILSLRVDTDSLTGLASRDRFAATLTASLESGNSVSVAFLDLDDFKTTNDALGHEAGDRLLLEVAARMVTAADEGDLVARFGGDEFAVLTSGDGGRLAETLLSSLRPPMVIDGREIRIELSIGVSTAAAADHLSAGDMLREADIAMYSAKRAGGGWARYAASMSAALDHRLDLRARLVRALDAGQIEAWYQPVVDLRSGALLGFEALARWCVPGQPPEPPGAWLPLAEESGLIGLVDRAVLTSAVTQLATWRHDLNVNGLRMAVNLSGRTLQEDGIEQEVLQVLRSAGVPAHMVTVEVTEGVLIEDEEVGARLQRLRTSGVRIALDDFGTGWSSLSNLRRFPVDQIKLDRSFTEDLCSGPAGEAVPAAVIQLARALGLRTVAEGVETLAQRDRLIELGFVACQGYLFGRAEPAAAQYRRVSTADLATLPVIQIPSIVGGARSARA